MNGKLSPYSGEYIDTAVEAAFRQARFSETVRQSRIFLVASIVLNSMFLVSDWRFYGDPHFWIAVPARVFCIVVSLASLCLVECAKSPGTAQRVLIAYEILIAGAVSLLVTSQSQIAIFAVIVLPAIFYLALPTPFFVTLSMGVLCSLAMLIGFILPAPDPETIPGLLMAMLTMNIALTLVVSRGNRLRRLEWDATQSALTANAALDSSRKLLETVFMAVPIPLIVTERDSGQLLNANRAAVTYFGGLENVRTQGSIRAIYADPAQRDELVRRVAENGHVEGVEISISLPDGARRDMLVAGSHIELDGKDCVITGAIDISARKAMEARLEELATRDPLTGVLNRNAFFDRALCEMERARRDNLPLSVIMIDLDYFKLINDAFGHAAGDLTLLAFADLCREHLRAHDFIGRLGGEEFACVLAGADRPEAMRIAERLRLSAEDLKVKGAPPNLRVTISVGVAEIELEADDITPALARADLALYGAKMRGRNKVVLADQSDDDSSDSPRMRAISAARS